MITSGLVNQKRARFEKGFIHGRSSLSSEFIRPYVPGFDMPVSEKKSQHASPKTDMKLSQTTPLQINYSDIFAKRLSADERLYNNNLLKQLARIARGPEQLNRQMTTPGVAGIGSGSGGTVGPNNAPPVIFTDRVRPEQTDMDIASPADTLVKEEQGGGVVDNPRYTMPGAFPGPINTGDIESSSVQQIIQTSNEIDDIGGDADNLNDELEAQVFSDVVTQTPGTEQVLKKAVKDVVYDTIAQRLKKALGMTGKPEESVDIPMKDSPTQGGVTGLPNEEPESITKDNLLKAKSILKSGASKVGKTFKKAPSKGKLKAATEASDDFLLRGLKKIRTDVEGRMDEQEDDWASPIITSTKKSPVKSEMSVESPVTPVDLRYYAGLDLGPRKRPFVDSEFGGLKRKRLVYDPLNPKSSVDGGEFTPGTVSQQGASEAQVLREIESGELTKKVVRRLSSQGVNVPANVVDAVVRQTAPSLVIDSKFSSDAIRITHSPISANIPEPDVRKAIISNGVGPRRQSSGTVSIASSKSTVSMSSSSSSDYGPTIASSKSTVSMSSSSSSDYGPTGPTPKVVIPKKNIQKKVVEKKKKEPLRRSPRKPKKQ